MYVWWPTMQADIIRYVSQCDTCQRVKRAQRRTAPQAVRLATRPWQIICIDVTGPLPISKHNNEYIVDVIDTYTRYVEGWAVPEINMVSIANAVIERIICRYGLFEVMVSDRGSVFVGQLASHIYRALKIKRVITTAYHPQSNGIIERFHATLKTTLKVWSVETGSEWDELLPYAIFAYNTAYHTVIQEIPHFLNHGYDARLPIDTVINTKSDEYNDIHQYAVALVEKLQLTQRRVREILKEINHQRKESEMLAQRLNIQVGERVMMYDPTTTPGESSKLKVRWQGPYTVLERPTPVTYIINQNGQRYTAHVERLKRYIANNDDNNDNDSYTAQLEKLNNELEMIKQTQQTLLQRQALAEAAKVHLHTQRKSSSHKDNVSDGDDNDDVNDVESESMSAQIMCLHSGEIYWT